jgi:hypothetical protein
LNGVTIALITFLFATAAARSTFDEMFRVRDCALRSTIWGSKGPPAGVL